MKKYIVPEMLYVDLRAEERVCTCTYEIGYCKDPVTGETTGEWLGLAS